MDDCYLSVWLGDTDGTVLAVKDGPDVRRALLDAMTIGTGPIALPLVIGTVGHFHAHLIIGFVESTPESRAKHRAHQKAIADEDDTRKPWEARD